MYEMRRGFNGFSLTDDKWQELKMTHTGLDGGTVSIDPILVPFSPTQIRHDTVQIQQDLVKNVPDRDPRSRPIREHKSKVKTDVSHGEGKSSTDPQATESHTRVDHRGPQTRSVMTRNSPSI